MFCPHCNNKIPDGSNICPLCYANLAGVKQQTAEHRAGQQDEPGQETPRPRTAKKKPEAYTKGSRGTKRSADRTPMIIAFGLIVILVIIIAMIIRSMFSAGTPAAAPTPVPQVQGQNTPETNFIVFGSTPTPQVVSVTPTPTPALEITPTPAPQEASYKTLRKGDQGPEVVTLQQALRELGYLTSAADGNFGSGTMNAVKSFQSDNGLDADGIAGKLTQEKLFTLSSVTPIPETTVGPGDIIDLPG